MVSGLADVWLSFLRNIFQMLGMDESKPRGILILGILFGLGAVFQLILGFTGQPFYLLGQPLQGEVTVYVYLLFALVSIGLAYGFLKLKRVAFYAAILWFSWSAVNGIQGYLVLENLEVLADGAISIAFVGYIYSKKQYFVN